MSVQADVLVHQDYISGKCHTNQIQNSHLKQFISWGFGDWQPHPILYDYTTSGHKDLQRIYVVYIEYIFIYIIHIFSQNIFIYLYCKKKKCTRIAPIVLVRFIPKGQWQSCYTNASVVSLSVILSALSWLVPTLIWANRKLQPTSKIRLRFSSRLNTSNFSNDCLLAIFHLDYTRWCRFPFLAHSGNTRQCC